MFHSFLGIILVALQLPNQTKKAHVRYVGMSGTAILELLCGKKQVPSQMLGVVKFVGPEVSSKMASNLNFEGHSVHNL